LYTSYILFDNHLFSKEQRQNISNMQFFSSNFCQTTHTILLKTRFLLILCCTQNELLILMNRCLFFNFLFNFFSLYVLLWKLKRRIINQISFINDIIAHKKKSSISKKISIYSTNG